MDLSTPTPPSGTYNTPPPATPPPATPPPATPPPLEDVVSSDPLDSLLKQIIGGWFILTDGQGAVSKWAEPAELLFGKEAPDALGHSFFDGLLAGPLSEAAEQWRRFLATGEPPHTRALVEATARHAPSDLTFPLEAVFIPVKLDEGFDFSLFLEDLSFELPMNLMLLRMRQQHPVVVRALRTALDAEPQAWDGWRTAGTMVAFRPLAPTPWVEEALVRRQEERARQDAEREEALTNPDPGVHGESIDDLDDAAAVVARLLSALERIDELERVAGRLPGEVEQAKRDAQAGRARAEAAEREARQARAELELLRGAPAEQPKLVERLERLEAARLESTAGAEARLAAARSEAAEARADLERRLAELEAAGGAAVAAARAALEEDVQRLRAERAREAEATRAELAAALERIEAVQRDAERLRERVGEVTIERHEGEALAGDDRRRLEELQRAGEQAGARLDALRALADELREDSVRSAETSSALRAELDAVRASESEARAAIDALGDELATVRAADADAVAALRAELAAGHAAGSRVRGELEALREHVAALELSGGEQQVDLESLLARIAAIEGGESSTREQLLSIGSRLEQLASASGAAAEFEQLRSEVAALRAAAPGGALDELRRELDHLRQRAAERHDVDDLRRDLAALQDAGPDPALDELRRHVEHLRERTVARADFDELHRAFDALRDGGVGRTDLEAIREQLATLADGWAAKSDLDAVRGALDALGDRVPDREELDALRAQFAEARRSVAGRDELDALRERLDHVRDGLAPTAALELLATDLAALRDRGAGEQLDAVRAEIAAVREAAPERSELEALRTRLDELAAEHLDALRTRIAELEAGGSDREQLERLGADAERLRSTVDGIHARLDAAREDAAAARERAEAGAAAAEEARDAARHAAARIDEVDRGAGNVLAEVKATADRLEEVTGLAHAAHEAAGASRADQDDLRAAVARLGGEVQVAREQLQQTADEALGARQQAATANEAATAARDDAGRACEDAQLVRRELAIGRERLAAVDDTFAQLRADTGERIETLEGGLERLTEQVAAGRAESEARAAELLTELAAVRAAAEQANAGVAELRDELAAVRTQAELANAVGEKARVTADEAKLDDEKVDALQAEVQFAISTMEEMKAGLTSAGQAALVARREAEQAKKAAEHAGDGTGEHVTQVFREILGLAAKGRPRTLKKATDAKPPEPREPRHGFDDEPVPMAVIGIDGKFKELNPSFCRLVGYQEHEFAKAAWPSPHDRQHYAQQQEQFSELISGTLENVHVRSTFMHGQGLMVQVVGEITAVKGEDGLPSHLLLRAEERERAL